MSETNPTISSGSSGSVNENHTYTNDNFDYQELQVILTEYSALNNEVISCLGTQRQLLTLEGAIIGVVVGAIAIFEGQPILLLFAALVLGLLSTIMFEQTVKIQLIYDYIDKDISPRIKETLHRPDFQGFRWQKEWFSISNRTAYYGVLSLAKFLLGILLAALFCIFFYISKLSNDLLFSNWVIEEKSLFIIAIVVILIPVLLGSISVFGIIKWPTK